MLVEGPLDAIAVTLADRGHYAGVAPLGTAFTDAQADLLRPYLPGYPVIVGHDNDPAGHAAAERAYWQLAARGDNPHRLRLPADADPASLLHSHGPAALHDALATATPLARALIDTRIAAWAGHLHEVEARHHAVRAAADIIGALPPSNPGSPPSPPKHHSTPTTPPTTSINASSTNTPPPPPPSPPISVASSPTQPRHRPHPHVRRAPGTSRPAPAR